MKDRSREVKEAVFITIVWARWEWEWEWDWDIVNTADDKSLLQDSIALQHDYIALSESSEDLSSSSLEESDYSV